MITVTDAKMAEICIACNYDVKAIAEKLRVEYPSYKVRPYRIENRIKSLRKKKKKKKGTLPLDSGNYVSTGEVLKGSSTLYDEEGGIKLQWVKTDVEKQNMLDQFQQLVENLADELPTFEKLSIM